MPVPAIFSPLTVMILSPPVIPTFSDGPPCVAEITKREKERRRERLQRRKREPLPENLFKGLLYCGVCGHTFNRDPAYRKNGERVIQYRCLTCRDRGNGGKNKQFSFEKLKAIIYEVILLQIKVCADNHAVAERIRRSDPVMLRVVETQKEIEKAQRRIAYIEGNAERLLCDYYDGLLSKEDYQTISTQREDECIALAEKLDFLMMSIEQYQPDYWNNQKYIDVINWFQNQSELTRDMLDALVERIEVDGDMNITIRYKYQDEFTALDQFISENGGTEQ
jgi:hypothetical protein